MVRIDEIKDIAMVGARVMGSGIAQTFAQAGYAVRLQARRGETLRAARDRIAKNQEAMVRAGLPAEGVARELLARIRTTTRLEEATPGCHFVNESVGVRLLRVPAWRGRGRHRRPRREAL